MAFTAILLALIAGISAGIISGLIPGIHVNLIALLALPLAAFVSPLYLVIFIISLAITHSFLDSIPSIYLGAPDAGQELIVLPGHRMLHLGMGHNAIIYTLIGSLGSLCLGIILFPFLLKGMEFLAPIIKPIVGYLLALIMIFMIGKEKGKRWKTIACFLLAGSLGLIVFSIPNLKQSLFPLLSGLFGFPILLLSLLHKSSIPQQNDVPLTITKKQTVKSISAATGVGFIAAFLPGFGNSQAAIVATKLVGDIGDEGFLSLVGGINTANMLLSIGTIYMLDKARNGAIVAVKKLIGSVGLSEVLLFLSVALTTAGIATILAIYLSKVCRNILPKINYQLTIIVVLSFITILTFVFDSFIGLGILTTAVSIGMLASVWKVGKNHLMGALIVPIILFFLL